MKIYTLHKTQKLPITLDQAWDFLSNPKNLKIITPDYMSFNIISTIDYNGQQIDGATEDVLPMGDLKKKFEAFGWDVLEVKKGNDIEAILAGLAKAKSLTGKGKPVCILLYTEMGNGVDFMMHTHAWHGKAPNDEQLENALAQNPVTLGDY